MALKTYPARKALTIFNLAARIDGSTPPTNPITIANIKEAIIIPGFNANENAISEKEVKFKTDIEINCRKNAINNPITPPTIEMASDSVKNASSILLLLKPSERNVPTSTVRFATVEYIVIIAPIVAPRLKITVIKIPTMLIKVDNAYDCFSK